MCAVHVGIGHEDDAVIAQLVDVEVILQLGSEREDERTDLFGVKELVHGCLFHVEDLASQRKNRLKFALAPRLGRAAGGVALHQEHFARSRVLVGAVGELSR